MSPFINIVFQAEVSRYEDSDFEDHARRNCNELPSTRTKGISDLLRTISDGDVKFRRTDEAYLLRFLRARRFSVPRAYRLMLRYEEFKKNNISLYKDVDAFNMKQIGGVIEGVIPDSPDNGRITIMNFGLWNTSTTSVEELMQTAVLMNEVCIRQPKIQVLGFTIIIDLQYLSLNQVRCLSNVVVKQIISLMGTAFPVKVHGIHIINYSWLLNTALYMFKPLMPAVAFELMHFHGSDILSLHKFIDPCYLPQKYGGCCQAVATCDMYLQKLNIYKDDNLIEELQGLGYHVWKDAVRFN